MRLILRTIAGKLRTRLLLTVGLLLGLGIVGFWFWYQTARPSKLSLVFIGRYTNRKPKPEAAGSTLPPAVHKPLPPDPNATPDPFEKMHEYCLQSLVEDFNHRQREVELKLEVLDSGSMGVLLSEHYRKLAQRKDLLAVIDNSWGADLKEAAPDIKKLPFPIVLLNGDKGGVDFGPGRLFLGSGDTWLYEMLPMLREVLSQATLKAKPKWIFVTESEEVNSLTEKFKISFGETVPDATVPLQGAEYVPSRQAFRDAKLMIMKTFPHPRSSEPKVLLLNTHNAWGMALMDWIDSTFSNTTVLAFQSSISRRSEMRFGKDPSNRLIISSFYGNSVPTSLLERLRIVRKRWPEGFLRDDAVFFVRRCLVAIEVTTDLLGKMRRQQILSSEYRGPRLCALMDRNRGSSFPSTLGQLDFQNSGEEVGQNHFVLHQNQMVSSSPWQFSKSKGIIGNVRFGFQDFKLSSVKVEDNRFKADFYFWVRRPTDKLPVIPDTDSDLSKLEVQFVGNDPDRFHQRLVACNRMGNIEDRLYQVSGFFNRPMDGLWFPFDRQILKIELRAMKPTSELSVSPDSYNLLSVGTDNQSVDGWDIESSHIAVDRATARKIPGSESAGVTSSEFSTVQMVVAVKRRLWTSLMLVFAPLALMALSSLAVLYMVVDDHSGNGPHDAAETLKTQTELTLVCSLAVLTYLISYATLAPRLDAPIYSDYLVGGTLFICVLNFIFVVAISKRENHWLLKFLSHDRYRFASTIGTVAMFGCWLAAGVLN